MEEARGGKGEGEVTSLCGRSTQLFEFLVSVVCGGSLCEEMPKKMRKSPLFRRLFVLLLIGARRQCHGLICECGRLAGPIESTPIVFSDLSSFSHYSLWFIDVLEWRSFAWVSECIVVCTGVVHS